MRIRNEAGTTSVAPEQKLFSWVTNAADAAGQWTVTRIRISSGRPALVLRAANNRRVVISRPSSGRGTLQRLVDRRGGWDFGFAQISTDGGDTRA